MQVVRDVYTDEYENLPNDTRDEESDGQTYFLLDDGTELYFLPNSEDMSIFVCYGKMKKWGESYEMRNFSRNKFWERRIGRKIISVSYLWGDDEKEPYGFKITFDNGKSMTMKYVSDEMHVDSLVLSP